MSSVFDMLCSKQLITDYPSFMKNNIHYEVIMGSVAYGVSDDTSDVDIYGFCMPPKHLLFPYSYGNIYNFGGNPETFHQYQKHHIKDISAKKEYDVSMYNIVKFFDLCMENNPNMIDALYVPTRCVLHSTSIGGYVRDKREIFLSKLCWHKFKGYAFSQLHKMKSKFALEFVNLCNVYGWDLDLSLKEMLHDAKSEDVDRLVSLVSKIETNGKRSKRLPTIRKYGFDVKFGYHVVRLLDECQQILEEGDLDLTRSREHLKAIRRGEWSIDNIISYFDSKLIILEKLYSDSKLRYSPNEENIKELLLECLEMHYGSLDRMEINLNENMTKYIIDAHKSLEKVIRKL